MSGFSKLSGCVNCAEPTGFVDCAGEPIREDAALATCADLEALPPPTTVAITDTKAGSKIATVTVDGTPTEIKETITTLQAVDFDGGTRTLSIEYKGEDGAVQTKEVNIPAVDAVEHIAPEIIDENDLYPERFNKIVSDGAGKFWAFDVDGNPTQLNFIETVTALSATLAAGHKIGTYTNESGATKDILETVTVLGTVSYDTVSGVLSIPFTAEDGTTVTRTVTIPPAAAASGTPFLLAPSTTADAGSNKTANIWRAGRVGLGAGTTAPTHQLDIVPNFSVRNAAGAAGSGYAFEINTNANAPRMDIVFNGAYVGQFKATANDFLYVNSRINIGAHRWQNKRTVGGDYETMTLLNNGNWGLNQTNPQFTADINGTARIVNTPTIVTATKTLVKNPGTGQVSEQNIGQLVSLTTAQINALTGQSNGQMYYNSTINKVVVRENSAWMRVTTSPM